MCRPFHQRAVFLGLLLFASWLVLTGCGSSDGDPEKQAQAIYNQAKAIETQGDVLGALKEYDRLVAYPETKAYATARNELLKKGYSLGAGPESWTAKQLVEVENELVHQGMELNPKDGLVVRLPRTDAWGQYLWVEYSTGFKYVFRVMSAGPDGKPDTGDELALYHKPPHQVEAQPPQASPSAPLDETNIGAADNSGLDETDDLPSESGAPAARPALSAMEAEELKKFKAPDVTQAPGKQTPDSGAKPKQPVVQPGSSREQTVDIEDLL